MDNIIQDIRKRCRMAMNGVASASMRNSGLNYKLNFGVSIQQIKEIASLYDSNKDLAEKLWLDETRELKILATLLYPMDQFDKQTANRWVEQIPNQEIREQVCLHLFQELHYADEIATAWINNKSVDIRTTGYWLLSRRILSKKLTGSIDLNTLSFVWTDVISDDNVSLRNAANLFLRNMGRISESIASNILEHITPLKNSKNPIHREVFDSLSFEFDFYYEKY